MVGFRRYWSICVIFDMVFISETVLRHGISVTLLCLLENDENNMRRLYAVLL